MADDKKKQDTPEFSQEFKIYASSLPEEEKDWIKSLEPEERENALVAMQDNWQFHQDTKQAVAMREAGKAVSDEFARYGSIKEPEEGLWDYMSRFGREFTNNLKVGEIVSSKFTAAAEAVSGIYDEFQNASIEQGPMVAAAGLTKKVLSDAPKQELKEAGKDVSEVLERVGTGEANVAESMKAIGEMARERPGMLASELMNMLAEDPEYLLIPYGGSLGARVAGFSATEKMLKLGASTKVAKAAGRVAAVPGSAAGAYGEAFLTETYLEGQRQREATGDVDYDLLYQTVSDVAEFGGIFGAATGLVGSLMGRVKNVDDAVKKQAQVEITKRAQENNTSPLWEYTQVAPKYDLPVTSRMKSLANTVEALRTANLSKIVLTTKMADEIVTGGPLAGVKRTPFKTWREQAVRNKPGTTRKRVGFDNDNFMVIEDGPMGRTIRESQVAMPGKGTGTKMYSKMAAKTIAEGKPLFSDSSVSQSAAKVWEKLGDDMGFDVKKSSFAKLETNKQTGEKSWVVRGPDGELVDMPVFTVRDRKYTPPPEAQYADIDAAARMAEWNAMNRRRKVKAQKARDWASKKRQELKVVEDRLAKEDDVNAKMVLSQRKKELEAQIIESFSPENGKVIDVTTGRQYTVQKEVGPKTSLEDQRVKVVVSGPAFNKTSGKIEEVTKELNLSQIVKDWSIDETSSSLRATAALAGGAGTFATLALTGNDLDNAIMYGGAGLVAGYAFPGLLNKISGDMLRRFNEIDSPSYNYNFGSMVDGWDRDMTRMRTQSYRLAEAIRREVPSTERRKLITQYMEEPKKYEKILTKEELALAKRVQRWFRIMAQKGQKHGIFDTLQENYVTHLWAPGDRARIKGAMANYTSLKTGSKFSRTRTIPTYKMGKDLGLEPLTEDIAEIFKIYYDNVEQALVNQKLINTLKKESEKKGKKAAEKFLLPTGKAPSDWIEIKHPQLSGYRVSPELELPMMHVFNTNQMNTAVEAVYALNFASKRMLVSFSGFHAMALGESFLFAGGNPLNRTANQGYLSMLRYGRSGDMVDFAVTSGLKIGTIEDVGIDTFYNGLRKFSHVSKNVVDGLVSGATGRTLGAGDAAKKTVDKFADLNHWVDYWMWDRIATGSKLVVFAKEMEKALLKQSAIRKSTLSREYKANDAHYRGILHELASTFDEMAKLRKKGVGNDDPRVHELGKTASELQVSANRASQENKVLLQAMAKASDESMEAIGRDVAEYVNDAFGGLNWRKIAESISVAPRHKVAAAAGTGAVIGAYGSEDRLTDAATMAVGGAVAATAMLSPAGRKVSNVLLTPAGRKFLQFAAFAPDWTLANLRILYKAMPGMAKNKRVANLHRAYAARALAYYTLAGNAITLSTTGEYWNPLSIVFPEDYYEPFKLPLGDGRYMVLSKQFMEPFEWAEDPVGTASGKMGSLAGGIMEVANNRKWVSQKGAPPIWEEDDNAAVMSAKVAAHFGSKYAPIAVGQMVDTGGGEGPAAGVTAGLSGMFGKPIYYKSGPGPRRGTRTREGRDSDRRRR